MSALRPTRTRVLWLSELMLDQRALLVLLFVLRDGDALALVFADGAALKTA